MTKDMIWTKKMIEGLLSNEPFIPVSFIEVERRVTAYLNGKRRIIKEIASYRPIYSDAIDFIIDLNDAIYYCTDSIKTDDIAMNKIFFSEMFGSIDDLVEHLSS